MSKIKKPEFKIAFYVRVSTEEQAQSPEGSIKNQEERLRRVVRERVEDGENAEIVGVFVDPGLSGKDTKRPELQRMFAMIRKREINLVIVSELSRLSRNTKDFCEMWEFFQEHDCEFTSLREKFDTTTAAGEMMLHMMMNFAQL
jgi:site-specific DNA recombinase